MPRRPGTGEPEHHAPWKFVETAELKPDAPVTLVWVPQSLAKAELSPLMSSDKLIDASSRCVALRIVLPEQAELLKKLAINAPAAVILDRQGKVIRSTQKTSPSDVESLLAAELDARDEAVYRDLHSAAALVKAGNNAAAIDAYQKIWADRCLFSVAGHEAQRELAKLGVVVKEVPKPLAPDPNTQPAKKPAP